MPSGIKVPEEAYATLEDVVELLPNRQYSATSRPTAAQAENTIKKIAGTINASLCALGYDPVPLTHPDDILILAHINALGAAVIIESATLGVVQGESPVVEGYRDEYRDYKASLQSGKYKFKGATPPTANEAEGPDELEASGSRKDPVFINSQSERKNQF